MSSDTDDPAGTHTVDSDLTSEPERAAMRAFLQRCEVRLSTLHRVATALLSGAGLLVLLPAVARDAVLTVLRGLLHGRLTTVRALLTIAVSLSLLLTLALVWLVLLQLTRFYFHANHIIHDGDEVFTPRFTLTSLRLPLDELGAESARRYDALRAAPHNLQLLVPDNNRSRAAMDRQLGLQPTLGEPSRPADADVQRAEALLELVSARRRSLLDEVVKVEYGMARHILRLQVVVLRYVKAVLVVIATVLATYAAAAAAGPDELAFPAQRWIGATMALWAPVTILVVTSPVRWLEAVLRTEGAARSAVHNDVEFTQLEDLASWVALAAWILATVASVLLLRHHITTQGRVGSIGMIAASAALMLLAVTRWRGSPTAT